MIMLNEKTPFLIAVSFVALLLGCGKLHPNAGQNDKLTLGAGPKRNAPKSNPDGSAIGFSLLDGPAELTGRTFSGALVLWHPDITAEGFAQLFTKTKAYNSEVAKSQKEFLKFESETLLPGVQRYKVIQQELSMQKTSQRTQIDEQQLARAEPWLQTQRDEFASELGSPDAIAAFNTQFDSFMNAYCEAQIVRFSLSAVAAKGVFWKRPSPAALCERRYADQGFLQGDKCTNAEGTGKNYWDCLWTEGTIKTRYWKLLPLKSQQVLGAALGSEQGRILFGPSVLEHADPCSANTLKNALLKLEGSVNCSVISNEALSVAMTTADPAGVETAVGADKRNKSLATATPEKTLFLLGSFVANAGRTIPQTSFPDAIRPLPDTLTLANGTTLPVAISQRVSLANRLKLMVNWNADSGCSEDLKSPNDSVFNGVRLVDTNSLRPCPAVVGVAQATPNIEWKPEPVAGQEDPNQVLNLITSARAQFCLPKAAGACGDPLIGSINTTCRLEKRSQEKLLGAREKNVSQGFLREVKFSFTETNLIVSFSNGRSFSAPIDFNFRNVGNWTGDPSVLQSRINATTGALEIKIALDPRFFASEIFSSEDASDIRGLDKFSGKTLELELFSNALEGLRPYLSGKLFIKDSAGNTLAQGVASYLLDSSFDDKVAKICGANLENWNSEK
jgi:hypothetical protein